MRRGLALLLLVVGTALLAAPPLVGEERRREGIRWYRSLSVAREAAERTGRPIWIALHPRVAPDAAWPYGMAGWREVYDHPDVVRASRPFVCVLWPFRGPPRVVSEEGRDTRPELEPPLARPQQLVLGPDGRVLRRMDGWDAAAGDASVRELAGYLARGLADAPPIAADAPPARPPRWKRRKGGDAGTALTLAPNAAGLRVHVSWPLPTPGDGLAPRGPARLYVDGEGPYEIGRIEVQRGEPVKAPLTIRFADHPGLAEQLAEGKHVLDIYWYRETADGSNGAELPPLHVARVFLSSGQGGGGGGGADQQQPRPQPQPQPQPSPPPPSPAQDEQEQDQPPPPPPPAKENPEVVTPFMNEGDTVKKDKAVVAAKDDDAALEPPPPVPLAERLRAFEKVLEEAVDWERIPARDRAYLRRYFEALRRAARTPEAAEKR